MFDILDELSELVYVVDFNTYELLYMNPAGKKMFGLAQAKGMCYQVLQGRDTPCDFCTNPHLEYGSFYTWERTNPVVGRHYLLKDKLIDWQGKRARVEIAFDMTQQQAQKEELQNALDAESMVLDCVKRLQASQDLTQTLHDILACVGQFLQADRTYLFEIRGQHMSNTYEWSSPGVQPQKDRLQDMDLSLISRWRAPFQRHECVVIQNIGDIQEHWPEEYRALRAQGIQRMVASPLVLDGAVIGFIGVDNPPAGKMRNISSLLNTLGHFVVSSLQREASSRLLEMLSYHDTLTGTLNRNAFVRDVEEIFSRDLKKPVGVVYVDINGLKSLNDQFGHPHGDRVLKQTVEKMRVAFPGDYLYRMGGDEFVIVCRGRDQTTFDERVRALKKAFAAGQDCAALGSQWSDSGVNIQRVVFEADELMYTDKKNFYRGRAVSKRYRHGNDDILGMTKPGALRKMLELGQFAVYFQPKMSVQSRDISGAEALVRYKTPYGVLIPPDQFIPVLEESRLISEVDFYVFEHVCGCLRDWERAGLKRIPISVNFSRYTLSVDNFLPRLNDIWKRYGVPQSLLELEVTESVEAEDNQGFLRVLERTRAAGYPVSIDDFGVKYANLSLFTSVDFDALKIDKTLVTDLQKNEKSQAIVKSVSDICRQIGVHLIVEGVETEEQLEVLRTLNCASAQGYLVSRPLPREQFEAQYLIPAVQHV